MGEKVGQGDLMAQLFVHGGIVSQDSINRGVRVMLGWSSRRLERATAVKALVSEPMP